MSQENVEIVRSIYDAWARNELPGPAHLLDAQIVYVNPPDAIEPGTVELPEKIDAWLLEIGPYRNRG